MPIKVPGHRKVANAELEREVDKGVLIPIAASHQGFISSQAQPGHRPDGRATCKHMVSTEYLGRPVEVCLGMNMQNHVHS